MGDIHLVGVPVPHLGLSVWKTARRNFLTVIEQGHEAWRLSLGQNPTKLEPGLHLNIPVFHIIQRLRFGAFFYDLGGFTSDNVPVLVSGSLFYRVNDSYHACFSVNNFKDNVRNIGTSAIRSILGHFSYDNVISDRNKTNKKLHETIGSSIEKWGVECTRFEIQTFKPLNRERERRKQLLDTQALVNVAEGHKQRTILESEGASVNQGQALAQPMSIVASALAGENKAATLQDRSKALEVLVELRRLEQLKAIAQGSGNTTYFLDPLKVGRDAYGVDNMEKWKRSQDDSEQAVPAVEHRLSSRPTSRTL
ncbi:hypothetical protein GLOTRDRAFT_102358 [Gloeophyllum trabeum ATCC 11539]|uniref:Band 7 domain-containing protein n=1 Tax=Gloeophyllum trabeum (strain ATCC 11539 / FP-39264 / Madison 617) TaxID=670483 RepID=S7RZX2_GLOTA|nr:uncharacterized protein GLOTRDRAFT_102358 [Gloeophyllum trabeum ATCC 11539]EPQ60615.1 hypothetical protein GLOTRDRAFT_102358 [Gloeophyllum trabeum ATCC 11539]